jgi:hypothetical protein
MRPEIRGKTVFCAVDLPQNATFVANYYEVMISVDELLKLAQDCYAQAKLTSNSLAKTHLVVMGDDYLKQAEGLQRDRSIVQAVFPMPGPKIG